MKNAMRWVVLGTLASGMFGVSCGDDDDGGGGSGGRIEQTGALCSTPAQCYPHVADAGALAGEVVCLTKVTGGYCTHRCQTDDDCCKVAGECQTNIRQVCSSFENTDEKYCFLSCEDADIQHAAVELDGSIVTDSTQYCALEASKEFTCRSSGGGSENRKVCLP